MSEPAVLAWREQHHGSLGGFRIVCYPSCVSGVRSFCWGDAGADFQIAESTIRQFVQVFTSIGVLPVLSSAAAVSLVSVCRRLRRAAHRGDRRRGAGSDAVVARVPAEVPPGPCWHRGVRKTAGALCRYIKCVFTPGLPRIFLDSDYLFVLDALFDTVRTDVATRVIISTREVLRRMWCVIVSRRSCRQQCPYHDRQVRRLHASSEAYLHVLEKAWSEEEVHARYIKCVLTPDLPRILLDSDNLFVLDALLDTVRTVLRRG